MAKKRLAESGKSPPFAAEIAARALPKILAIGVGGAGGNAIENMVRFGLDGVIFATINTDAQAMRFSSAERGLQIGPGATRGLGAGADPEIGREAAEESFEEISKLVDG